MSVAPRPNSSDQKLVLIVDDVPANIGAVAGALKDSYKTKVATNSSKALALASADEKPDLILLDVVMPEMDGYEICSRLKADPSTREIPIIFLTGQTSEDDETRGFEVGAVDYVHKPFSPAVVKARVRSHILLRESRAQLAGQLRAINQELETARQIQQSILPHSLPQLPGLEIAARFLPMSAVAGDFYDFISIDETRLGLLVADVSGHGLPSSLIASMLKVALSTQTANASDPVKVLSGLNKILCGKFTQNFVTAVYVYLDLDKRRMCYAGAGHPPVFQYRKSIGKATELLQNGLVLGMFEDAVYDALDISLEPGDRQILYTDGVVEATNAAGEMYGADRFIEFIQDHWFLSAAQLADAFLAQLKGWTAQPLDCQQDDITLLLFDFKA